MLNDNRLAEIKRKQTQNTTSNDQINRLDQDHVVQNVQLIEKSKNVYNIEERKFKKALN